MNKLPVTCIARGTTLPMYVSTASWHLIVFGYIAVASIVPVLALLHPRDHFNSYLLVAIIFGYMSILMNKQMMAE